ncbi:MAG TPA: tetratricopeptide repeat protein [Opitutaceae bacterium]|nr:tetratricopeptide repeat protein [Opitutaceae bacterium]
MPVSAPSSVEASAPRRSWRAWCLTHRWFLLTAAFACLVFGAVVTQGTGRILAAEPFGSFYDAQAESLLNGHLDVPPEAIEFEAFVHDHKSYGYFGPTPALLRLPWALIHAEHGRLTRLYLLGYFAASLLAAYLLLRDVCARRTGGGAPRPPWIILVVLNAGLGSTLLYLGSRAYVYHEAILCGVAFALWSIWATLRYARTTALRWALVAVGCGLLSLHARAPTGLFSLTCLALAAAWIGWRRWRSGTGVGSAVGIIGAAVLALASFNALSYLKFGTFEGCPLRMNIQYTPERLAQFGGREFHAGNLAYGLSAYFGLHVATKPYFPLIAPVAVDPARFAGAKVDLTEGILGIPFAMPGLTLAALLGLGVIVVRRRELTGAAALVWLGVVPMTTALCIAVAFAHRYTADFCPFLIAAAIVGIGALDQLAPRMRTIAAVGLSLATFGAVAVTLTITLDYQGRGVWGVPLATRQRYADLSQGIDHALGLKNPAGYDAKRLGVSGQDRHFAEWLVMNLTSDPARQPQAIAECRKVISFFPEYAPAYLRLGTLLIDNGSFQDAVATYRSVLTLYPGFVPAHFNLSAAYFRLGQLDDALAEIQTVLRLTPQDPDAKRALAFIQAARRQRMEAGH